MKIYFSHLSEEYKKRRIGTYNGAYWYSKELVENILPKIKSDRSAITINMDSYCEDNAVVFIHNNDNPKRYEWLQKYKNLILICSKYETLATIIEIMPKAHVVYLPLSIDTTYVKQFKAKRKTKNKCYIGRPSTAPENLPKDVKVLGIMERDKMLAEAAKYKIAYATGRCLLEAKCLGLKTVNTSKYTGSEELLDNKKVIPMLQKLLNEIDMKG